MAEHAHTAPAGQPALIAGLAPLDQIQATLRLLCTTPRPLAIDGRRIGCGLPRRPIRVTELAAIMAHPSCSQEAKRRVWQLLVRRARARQPGWAIAAAGVALPGLRRAAARLPAAAGEDVQADLLEGFLAGLADVDTSRPGICGRLVNAALVHARGRLREQQAAASGESRFAPGSALPPPPVGHPDLVLARAVRAGVLTALEAELIGATRLESTTLAAWADAAGVARKAAYERRALAEAKLVAAIKAGTLADPYTELIADATATVHPEPADAGSHRPAPAA